MLKSKAIPSIQSLKRIAKQRASHNKISLNIAQDLVANEYGYSHWSVMLKCFNSIRINSIDAAWQSFLPGELILLSALEGVGKFSMALNLAERALQEDTEVKYLSLHVDIPHILERLSKITDSHNVEGWLSTKQLIVKNNLPKAKLIINEVVNAQPETVVVIDYLQAVNVEENKKQDYSEFLHKIKSLAQEKGLKIIVLSQVYFNNNENTLAYIDGESRISHYFSHVIYLERQHMGNKDQRKLELVKSIHYQKQKSLLQFDLNNFRFL